MDDERARKVDRDLELPGVLEAIAECQRVMVAGKLVQERLRVG
jgi:hypothetical protein